MAPSAPRRYAGLTSRFAISGMTVDIQHATAGWRAMTPSRCESPSRALRCALPLATAALLVTLTTAQAETVVNEDEFRDWIGRCETETTTGEVVCFIYTGRVAEVEGETLAARIVVGLADTLEPIVYLDVPDIAEPATGFMMQVDAREPFSGLFSNCSVGWCHTQATGEVAAVLVSQFRAGSQAIVSFVLEDPSLQVDMPMSLLGFTAAFTRLQQIHQQAAQTTLENLQATDPATDDAARDETAEDSGESQAETPVTDPAADSAAETADDDVPADTPADTPDAGDEPVVE